MIAKFKQILRRLKYDSRLLVKGIRIRLTVTPPTDLKQIPIVINNYNQLDFLIVLIDSLRKRGYHNIHILDNDSTYPPLLEFYRNTDLNVIRLKENFGHLSFWKSGVYKQFEHNYFVYTDPDLEIVEECPDDFMEVFFNLMQKYPKSSKVGFALKIDDLPDCFVKKEEVINWEKRFWENEVEENVFGAPIDTTFALYRPFTRGGSNSMEYPMRVGGKYVMRHLPWYIDSKNLSENMEYYVNSCRKNATHWGERVKG